MELFKWLGYSLHNALLHDTETVKSLDGIIAVENAETKNVAKETEGAHDFAEVE